MESFLGRILFDSRINTERPSVHGLSIPEISDMRRFVHVRRSSLPQTIRFCCPGFDACNLSKHAPATATRISCLRSGYRDLHFNQSLSCCSQIAIMQSANLR